jgi:nucleoside-triphosphate--adenylate kinase
MGPPGGGKGTISKKIIRDFGFAHLSTGDILRANVNAGTDLGKQAKGFMESGALVPDQLIVDLVTAEVSALNASQEAGARSLVLLDGFPRTLVRARNFDRVRLHCLTPHCPSKVQAEALSSAMDIDVAMNLEVPYEDIVQRISMRWTHPGSGRGRPRTCTIACLPPPPLPPPTHP